MSLMSTGRANLKAAVGAEFMVPEMQAAGSAPRGIGGTDGTDGTAGTAGRAAGGRGGREAGASERAERDLRFTELYFRELHIRQVRIARQVRTARQVRAVRQQRAVRPGGPRAPQARPREMGTRRSPRDGRPGPVRLTRRGRAVAAAVTILAATAIAVVMWLGQAAGAQASSHVQPAGAGYLGMTQVVVRPGQTLWSIAAAAEPAADTRIVIQQIMDANALGGTSIRAGELLWVPKG